MGIKDKLIDLIAPPIDDYEEDVLEVSEEEAAKMGYEKAKRKEVSVNASARLVMFEPRTFDDAPSIAAHLVAKRACIVNFHRSKKEQAQRTIDFLYGVTYAIRGSIKKLDVSTYVCTPQELGVAGSIDLENDD